MRPSQRHEGERWGAHVGSRASSIFDPLALQRTSDARSPDWPQFRAGYIAKGNDFDALYIGGVAALPRAHHHVIKCLRRRLQRHLAAARESGREFVRVCTRPTTAEGLALVTNARLGRVMVRVFKTEPAGMRE